MKLLEAIPGHRVIVRNFPFAPELDNATGTVIAPDEYSQRFSVAPGYLSVGVELDEPYASRWTRRDVFIKAEHLEHAPSYAEMVRELAATREVKDNLTKEVDALGGTITGLRETVRVRDAAINVLKEREDRRLTQVQRLQDTVQRLRQRNIELERAAELVQPHMSLHLVNSDTVPGQMYTITVRNGEVADCSCPGYYFHGHCKHADRFVIPVDARDNRTDVLRQIAELVKPYQS